MPNTFLTPDIIARQAYANLYENTVMAQLVHRDYSGDFGGKVGDTITIRRPATFEAETYIRANGITVQDGTESGIPVTLDNLLDVSFAVTTEDLTLELADFNEQLLAPATEAIVQAIDRAVLTLRADVIKSVEYDSAQAGRSLIRVAEQLNVDSVPTGDRHAVLTTGTTADFLEDPLFHQADQRGDTDGLREANIGRKFGFNTYMSQNADGGESLAFHRTAFALVSRTLELPRGASNAAVFGARDGFGIRVVQDYDIDQKQDVVSLDVLIGVATLDADRAVLIEEEPAG